MPKVAKPPHLSATDFLAELLRIHLPAGANLIDTHISTGGSRHEARATVFLHGKISTFRACGQLEYAQDGSSSVWLNWSGVQKK
ncbi:hypothetical protein DVJ83_17705 (plasmid) [Deinococcus wulumuqiensis]|uniref:Uncharacterized protein n=1 Tax=Deinococcus wulumuqiensis TaxID=980427 RepID=A0A345IML7_9DEIO|nr:hypothetical protein [Deinococcus wulumuqiensis]AXH00940.1 hypothetical protein DVJ83_17705 [Deinococcus wulumuqiensis]